MSSEDLVTVQVTTRHPEDYLLLNRADGTAWEIVDGEWRRAAADR